MSHWWNDYLGLPYARLGRTRDGLDCWGLVRMVYAEQFGVDLPSLDYDSEVETAADALALARESWGRAEVAQAGDVVQFRVLGQETHVGLITRPGYFLHVREGQESVIERLDSGAWKHRVVGIWRYGATATAISTLAHPLRTARLDLAMPAGLTLYQMADIVHAQGGDALDRDGVFFVDGAVVPRARWTEVVPRIGARVEYRAVAGKSGVGRIIATIAVMAFAWWAAAAIVKGMAITQGIAGLTVAQTTAAATGLVSGAINMVGGMLINQIFPTRPSQAKAANPGSPEQQHLLLMGSNVMDPYGAIPVVLGRVRYTPPLGTNYHPEFEETRSYLRMVLCWGYGPVEISDVRVASTPLAQLEDVEHTTLYGRAGEVSTEFDRIYGEDVVSEGIDIELLCEVKACTSAQRTANVVTVVTSAAHGATTGAQVQVFHGAATWWQSTFLTIGEVIEIVDSTTLRIGSGGADGPLFASGSAWALISPNTNRVLNAEVDRINVALHFPQGLRDIGTDGKTKVAYYVGDVLVRQLDSVTLQPVAGWWSPAQAVSGTTRSLSPAWYNTDSDADTEEVYRWTRLSVNEYNSLIQRDGAYTTDPAIEPSGLLLTRQQRAAYGVGAEFVRLPALGAGEEPLWDVCVKGNAIHQVVDQRANGTVSVTGCALTYSGLDVTLAAGTVARADGQTVRLGGANQPHTLAKDAFTYVVSFAVPRGKYEVRANRLNDSNINDIAGVSARLHSCRIISIVGISNTRPIIAPKNTRLALTALRIKANNQVSGRLDGIQGTVESICKEWDGALNGGAGAWVDRPTRNPASLFRYVLQHPANAKAVPDEQLDLPTLQAWHVYCGQEGFTFDMVVNQQRSLLDVLRDIAAAGRASPVMRDGKWSVVVDEPRASYAQYFTPHNSWGFAGVRAIPQLPHAFRVQFTNSDRAYQADERLVYDDGQTAATATLIESLNLPGVTRSDIVFKHARFHLAQAKLRSEMYTLNADIEHLVCNRGDLVRVLHDVPMWGLGSGRIKARIDGTHIEVDEPLPMKAGTQYTIRIRLEDGTSVVRTVAAAAQDGEFTTLTLTTSVTTNEAKAGLLVMFGSLNQEAVDCIVLSVEPQDNMSAQLTLCDYAPAVYDSDTEVIPPFNSQITRPPRLMQQAITQRPTITLIRSDESVAEQLTSTDIAIRMRVSFRKPAILPANVTHIEGQIDIDGDGKLDWKASKLFPVSSGSVTFTEIDELETYRVRLRFVAQDGRCGPWTPIQTHQVIGLTTPPATPTGLTAKVADDGILVHISWLRNTEIDFGSYEMRLDAANFGNGLIDPYYAGRELAVLRAPVLGPRTYYLKAIDKGGRYSTVAASYEFTGLAPDAPTALTVVWPETGSTEVTVKLDWTEPDSDFLIKRYEATLTKTGKPTRSWKGAVSEWITRVDWIGDAQLEVKAVNVHGWAGTVATLNFSRSRPPVVTSGGMSKVTTKVSAGERVLWDWTPVAQTSLPIAGYEIRSTDDGFGTAGAVYRGAGSRWHTRPLAPGEHNFYLRAYDTGGVYSETSLLLNHDSLIPPNVATCTISRVGRMFTLTATVTEEPPADFSHYEFRIGRVRTEATGGADSPHGITASGDFWTDPDVVQVKSQSAIAQVPIIDVRNGLGFWATYRVACRMVDDAGNVSAASALGSLTLAKIAP